MTTTRPGTPPGEWLTKPRRPRLFTRWSPVLGHRGTVAIIHGFCEHAGRYGHVQEALAGGGYASIASDLRGHGHSDGKRAFITRFSEYLDDAETVLEAARARADGGPVFLLGHSMGGLISSLLLIERGPTVDGLILSSPFIGILGSVPLWKRALGRVASLLQPGLTLPAEIPLERLTHDPEIIEATRTDPLMVHDATARWYTETVGALARNRAGVGEIRTPVLLMYGADDHVVDAEATRAFGEGLRGDSVEVRRLEGLYHEILNETERPRLLADVVTWLDARVQALAQTSPVASSSGGE